MSLGVEPQHVSDVQALIVAVVAEHRKGESKASAAKRVLEGRHQDAKPAAASPEEKAPPPEAWPEEKATAPPVPPSSEPPPAAAASPGDADIPTEVGDFLEGLGLARFKAQFEEEELDMPTLHKLHSADRLERCLREIGLSFGACVKVAEALERNDTAAKKAAEIQQANDQAMAAAKQLAHETERNERLRKELDDVRGRCPAPETLICPITTLVMVDPVVAADGFTYEREAIERWLENHNSSPTTNAALAHTGLTSNQTVRSLVRSFLDNCARTGTNPDSLI